MLSIIGKTMAGLHFLLAFAALMVSAMFFTQRVKWVNAKDEKGDTKIEALHKQYQSVAARNQESVNRWTRVQELAVVTERDYLLYRDFYDARMKLAETGKLNGGDVANPIREYKQLEGKDTPDNVSVIEIDFEFTPLNFDPNQILPSERRFGAGPKFTTRKPVEFRPGLVVKSFDFYETEIVTINKRISELQKEIAQKRAEYRKTDDEIIGIPTEKIFGLRELITQQVELKESAETEYDHLEQFITNRKSDGELFIRRQASMEARIGELKKSVK